MAQSNERGHALSLLLLVALCLFLFFFRLGDRPLWDTEEGLHASTSREMVLTGDWVTPKVNGANFYDKTALFNWFVSLSFMALGFTEFAARLPAALLGLATVLLTYSFGKRLFSAPVGLLGGVVLATSPEFMLLSRTVVHDISLVLFVTLSLFFFYAAYSDERQRRRNLLLFYVSVGAAVLSKGPVGLVLPAMIVGLFLLLKGRLGFLKEMGIGWGVFVFLFVAGPWYVLISMRNPDYIEYFFLKQNLGNFLSKAQAHHPQPLYYYVPVLLGGMFPWSFFLPLAAIRPMTAGIRKVDERLLFLVCWFLVIVVFFSAARSKLATYVLPAFPAAALLIASIWHELISAPTTGLRRYVSWSILCLLLASVIGTLLLGIVPARSEKVYATYGAHIVDALPLLMAVTGMLIAATFLYFLRRYQIAFTLLGLTSITTLVVATAVYVPRIDLYRSTKVLAREADALLLLGEKLVCYRKLWDSVLFYTDHKVVLLGEEDELLDHFAEKGQGLCIISREEYAGLDRARRDTEILREHGNKLLIAKRPVRNSIQSTALMAPAIQAK